MQAYIFTRVRHFLTCLHNGNMTQIRPWQDWEVKWEKEEGEAEIKFDHNEPRIAGNISGGILRYFFFKLYFSRDSIWPTGFADSESGIFLKKNQVYRVRQGGQRSQYLLWGQWKNAKFQNKFFTNLIADLESSQKIK